MPKFGRTNRMQTPWGMSQTMTKIAPGIYHVTTASHGGYLIGKRVARERLTQAAQEIGMEWNVWLAYEEDCAWAIVEYELLDVREWSVKRLAITDDELPRMFRRMVDTIKRYYYGYYRNTAIYGL